MDLKSRENGVLSTQGNKNYRRDKKIGLIDKRCYGQRGDSSSSALVKSALVEIGQKGDNTQLQFYSYYWTKRRHDS